MAACFSGGRSSVFDAVEEGVCAEDFANPRLAVVWSTALELAEADKPVDLVTVCDALEATGKLDLAGGPAAIAQLEAVASSAESIRLYARRVLEGAAWRRLAEACQVIQHAAREREGTPQDLLADAQQAFLGLNERAERGDGTVDRSAAIDAVLSRNGDEDGATPTGLRELDGMLRGGLRAGQLVLVAARPGMGKSAFGLTVAAHVADMGVPVAFFSLEMTGEEVLERELAMQARAGASTLQRVHDGTHARAVQVSGHLRKRPLHIVEAAGWSISDITARARRFVIQKDVQLVVVDYLQLVKPPNRYAGDKVNEVAEISAALKQAAVQLKVPVIALSQLNREAEKRTDKRPMMADLRDSGALEQDANAVLLLHRPEYYLREQTPAHLRRVCEVIVAKNRRGATGSVDLLFYAEQTRFGSRTAGDEA